MRGLWLLVLTLLAWSTGAVAQQPEPPSGEAEAPPAAAAEGAEQPAAQGSDATAAQRAEGADAPAAAPAPDPDVLARAITHFRQGRAFADSGDCRGAVVEFQAAFDLIPRPSALYNIAQCQERLFRYDLAIEVVYGIHSDPRHTRPAPLGVSTA